MKAPLLAAALLCSIALSFFLPNYLVDDAYISFRYAENLALGKGLVYNVGEKVEGYTNFLWVLLLGGVRLLGIDIPPASRVLGFLSGLLTLGAAGLLSQTLFKERPLPVRALPVLLLAVNRPFWLWAVSGMETALYSLLLTLGTALFLYPRQAGFVAGGSALLFAATLTRPDGIMVFLTVAGGAFLFLREKEKVRHASLALGIYFFLLAAYGIWKQRYFGSLLPNTFYAKNVGEAHLLGAGVTYTKNVILDYGFGIGLAGVLLCLFAAPRGVDGTRIRVIALVPCAYIFYMVYAGGDIYFYHRFWTPVLPLFLVLMTSAALRVAESLPRIGEAKTVFAAMAILVIFSACSAALTERSHYRGWQDERAKHEDRERIAAWLSAHYPADTTIATIAAGYIPFATGMPTVDLAGLTNREIGRAETGARGELLTPAHEKSNASYVLSRQPAFVEFRLFLVDLPMYPESEIGHRLEYADFYPYFKRYPSHRELALREEFHRRYRLLAYPLDDRTLVATFGRLPEGEIAPAEALANTGWSHIEEGYLEEGLGFLLEALRAQPRDSTARSRLKRVLSERPGQVNAAEVRNKMGTVYFESGLYRDAADSFREAVRINPDGAAYRNNLSFVLIDKLDRAEEGVRLAAEALESDPRNPSFMNTYALGLFRTGETGEALEVIEESFTLDPQNPETRAFRELFRREGRRLP